MQGSGEQSLLLKNPSTYNWHVILSFACFYSGLATSKGLSSATELYARGYCVDTSKSLDGLAQILVMRKPGPQSLWVSRSGG